jgi:hypothetical protein
MSSVGLIDKPEAAKAAAYSNRRSKATGPTINTLLNRMLGLQVAMQGQLFAYFTSILDKVRGSGSALHICCSVHDRCGCT